jgi:hypothetical protein
MTAASQIAFKPRIAVPPTITEMHSWGWILRNAFFDKLKAHPFFGGFTARKSRALPVMTNSIPYLGVYLVNENGDPDGDLNAGEIRFIHHLKIGFSVIIVNNDPVACEDRLDQAYWTIMNTLWRDEYLTNLIDTSVYPGGIGTPGNARIEGVERGYWRHVYGNAGKDNETPIGELQYEATVRYRADYAPFIPDNLLQIHQETVPLKNDGTIPAADEVQRVVTEYEFDPYPPPAVNPLEEKE